MDTPTRLPVPPRVVHGGPGGQIWFLRLFILPHMAAGIGTAAFFVITVAVALFGTKTSGTVLGMNTSHSSKGGTTYHLKYRYYADWRCYTNSTAVSWSLFSRLSGPRNIEGDPVLVKLKYLALGPAHYQLLTEEGQVWGQAGGLLVFTLFWNGLLSVFVYLAWFAPFRRRRLVAHGEAAPGRIVKTRIHRGKSTSYYATFQFNNPATGGEIKREMLLPGRTQYEQAHTGSPVTVLFDPQKPKRAIIYELCGYRVDTSEEVAAGLA